MKQELIHPILVHFPIVFTVTAIISFFISVFLKWKKSQNTFVAQIAQLSLYLAIGFMGAALFTGDFAEDIVRRNLCDIRVLHEHEDNAYITLYLLLTALLVDLVPRFWKNQKKSLLMIFLVIQAALLFTANIYLVLTAHLGGKLVYEQAAGVQISAPIKCTN